MKIRKTKKEIKKGRGTIFLRKEKKGVKREIEKNLFSIQEYLTARLDTKDWCYLFMSPSFACKTR